MRGIVDCPKMSYMLSYVQYIQIILIKIEMLLCTQSYIQSVIPCTDHAYVINLRGHCALGFL